MALWVEVVLLVGLRSLGGRRIILDKFCSLGNFVGLLSHSIIPSMLGVDLIVMMLSNQEEELIQSIEFVASLEQNWV